MRKILFALMFMLGACASGPKPIPVEFVGGPPDEQTPQACKVDGKEGLKCEPLIPLLMSIMGGSSKLSEPHKSGPVSRPSEI